MHGARYQTGSVNSYVDGYVLKYVVKCIGIVMPMDPRAREVRSKVRVRMKESMGERLAGVLDVN